MIGRSLMVGLLCGMSLGASAAPFQARMVPAEARWWLHWDVEAWNATVPGQTFLDLLKQEEAERKLAAFKAVFGFDPRTDVTAVTLCGAGPQSAVILQGRFDRERILTLLKAADGYTELRAGNHVIHSWLDEKKDLKGGGQRKRMYGAFHGPSTVVLSEKESVVRMVLDTLEGRQPAIQPAETGPDVSGAFVHGVAAELPAGDKPNPNLQGLRGVRLWVGEVGGRIQCRLAVTMADEEKAGQLHKVLEGLRAMALLNAEQDPRAARWAQSFIVETSGSTISAQLDVPSEEIAQAIREGAQKKLNEATEKPVAQ